MPLSTTMKASAFAATCIALVLSGCGEKPAATAVTLPSVTVVAHTAESKFRVATEEVVGTVRAKLRSVIEAKVSGKIAQLRVVPGQQVQAGETLATIEAREVQARYDQAIAVHHQAEADLKRLSSLFEQKILSQAEFDSAQARTRIAIASMIEAEALLGYTKVAAPFAGVITRKHADVGDLAAPGKPLLEMEDASLLRLEADVPEAIVGKLKLRDQLRVHIAALEKELEGIVSEIAPAADPNSRTFLVKLELPATPGLRAGQFGRVAMPVGEARALRVPVAALTQRGQMELVFVIQEGQARLRIVKTGKRLGSEVELVSGLSAGERIIVAPVAELVDGQPVEAK